MMDSRILFILILLLRFSNLSEFPDRECCDGSNNPYSGSSEERIPDLRTSPTGDHEILVEGLPEIVIVPRPWPPPVLPPGILDAPEHPPPDAEDDLSWLSHIPEFIPELSLDLGYPPNHKHQHHHTHHPNSVIPSHHPSSTAIPPGIFESQDQFI